MSTPPWKGPLESRAMKGWVHPLPSACTAVALHNPHIKKLALVKARGRANCKGCKCYLAIYVLGQCIIYPADLEYSRYFSSKAVPLRDCPLNSPSSIIYIDTSMQL